VLKITQIWGDITGVISTNSMLMAFMLKPYLPKYANLLNANLKM
jgi:hypothetical protein